MVPHGWLIYNQAQLVYQKYLSIEVTGDLITDPPLIIIHVAPKLGYARVWDLNSPMAWRLR